MVIFIYMNRMIFCLLFGLPAPGQDSLVVKPAKNITVSEASIIKLYAFNTNNGCDRSTNVSAVYENKISPCFYYVKTFEKKKVKQIINMLRSRRTYGGKEAACFDTDYALVIFDKANVVTGYVNISLYCNWLIPNPVIPESKMGLGKGGFSKKGKERLLEVLELVSKEDLVAP